MPKRKKKKKEKLPLPLHVAVALIVACIYVLAKKGVDPIHEIEKAAANLEIDEDGRLREVE